MGARRGRTDAVLDRESPVPLYYQLAQNMETAIRQGRLSSGSHLDNEIELARQLRVSRPTVRRAIALLANRGLVIRRHGIGTLVVPVRVRRPVRLSSLYDDLQEAGQTPSTRLLAHEIVPAPAEVASSLQLSRGTRVLHFERLRLATDQPIALMRNFVPLSLEEVVTEEGLKSAGLYQLLRQNGIHLRLASQVDPVLPQQLVETRGLQALLGHHLFEREWNEVAHQCDRLVSGQPQTFEVQYARSPRELQA